MKKKTAKKKKKAAKKKKALSKTKTRTSKTARKRGGRPREYKAEFADRARAYAEDGAFSNVKLGRKFRVTRQTIAKWKAVHFEFAAAIEDGKNDGVESSEENLFRISRSKKVCSPVVKACETILKAHRREKYGDKVKLDGNVGLTLTDVAAIVAGKKKNG